MGEGQWTLYVLRCADGSLYTGITTDVERRLEEHNGSAKGARYTRSRRPVELEAAWGCEDHSQAAKAEYAFKSLRRREKLKRLDAATVQEAVGWN